MRGGSSLSLYWALAATLTAHSGCSSTTPAASPVDPYCDAGNSHDQRVADLLSRLNRTQKLERLVHDPAMQPVGDAAGLPSYEWGVEGQVMSFNSCLNANGCSDGSDPLCSLCGPTFPMPPALASAMNLTLIEEIGSLVGDSVRALDNWNRNKSVSGGAASSAQRALSVRGPYLNVMRDQRDGRNQERPAEDPWWCGEVGAAWIAGVQDGVRSPWKDSRYTKATAEAVVFSTYSKETNRHAYVANVSLFDLEDTYFRPFQRMVKAGGAGYMCSYPAISVFTDLNLTAPFVLHGEPVVRQPSCTSKFLKWKMRDVWGFQGFVESDCGAIEEAWLTHHFVQSGPEAAAAGISWGHTDIDCGNQYNLSMQHALDTNLTSYETIDVSLARRFSAMLKLGLLDAENDQPYTRIPPHALGWGSKGAQLNKEAARQSVVMLKRGSLPWSLSSRRLVRKRETIAVIGPLANSTGYLLGTYRGQICPGQYNASTKTWVNNQCGSNRHNDPGCYCVPTVVEALQNLGARVVYAPGVNVTDLAAKGSNDTKLIAEAVAVARAADRVVLVLGNGNAVENEAADRIPDRFGIQKENPQGYNPDSGTSSPDRYLPTGTGLPGSQEELAIAILSLKKPTVMALISGDGIAIDKLIAPSDAILFHAYPGGTGGTAIAESIFGLHNRFGRLTMTWLPKKFERSIDFSDFSFATLGRSYRYFGAESNPLFEFGEGLSFSDHVITATPLPVPSSTSSCEMNVFEIVVNTTSGFKTGDVVVMAFLVPKSVSGLSAGVPIPRRQLVGVQRVSKDETGTAKLVMALDTSAAQLTDLDGSRALRTGRYSILFWSGATTEQVTVPMQLSGC